MCRKLPTSSKELDRQCTKHQSKSDEEGDAASILLVPFCTTLLRNYLKNYPRTISITSMFSMVSSREMGTGSSFRIALAKASPCSVK